MAPSSVEEIEIAVRTAVSYFHAHKYGAWGYLDNGNFSKKHSHSKFIEILDREISSNSKELFIKHHEENYGGKFPIWVATEVFTFGMLSYFYIDMPTSDQKEIAKSFGLNYRKMGSYLRCCTDIRNRCAHYGRLYFRKFPAIPALPPEIKIYAWYKRMLFPYIIMLKILYPDSNQWLSEIQPSLEKIFNEYTKYVYLEHIGFTENWLDILKNG